MRCVQLGGIPGQSPKLERRRRQRLRSLVNFTPPRIVLLFSEIGRAHRCSLQLALNFREKRDTLCADSAARTLSSDHVLTTIAASGAHRHFGVCQDCAYLGGEMYRDSTSASRSALGCLLFGVPIEPDELVSPASIFSRRANTARAVIANEFTTAIC